MAEIVNGGFVVLVTAWLAAVSVLWIMSLAAMIRDEVER